MSQSTNHDRDGKKILNETQYTFQLPSRQSYFTTLSAIAFASGLGIAAIVTIRRGRKMRAEDIQQNLERSLKSTQATRSIQDSNILSKANKEIQETPLGRASSKGVFALFGEMNRSIFKREQPTERENTVEKPDINKSPSALQRRSIPKTTTSIGKNVQDSVFDASPSTPPPSVLMRPSKKVTQKVEIVQQSTTLEEPEQEAPTGDSPVFLAIKAIGIATAIVGAAAFVSVQIACKIFKVNSTDELIEHLTTIIPSSERNGEMFDKIGQSARKSLKGKLKVHKDSEELDLGLSYSDKVLRDENILEKEPLPVQEAMKQLDDAIERGDAAAWMDILSKQLNAERRKDLQERQNRIEKASTGAVGIDA